MKTTIACAFGLLALLVCSENSQAQWVAYNDHAPTNNTAITHPHATPYNVFSVIYPTNGYLTNIADGAQLPVTLSIARSDTSGVTGGASAEVPAAGTPLYTNFNGYVWFGNSSSANGYGAIQVRIGSTVTYTFSNLDPLKRYRFSGGAVRGGSYNNRWTLIDLQGIDGAAPNHQQGTTSPWGYLDATRVPGWLTGYQVAMLWGENRACGDMVQWVAINPGTDGNFVVTCTQYSGSVPAGFGTNTSPGTADGSMSYAITGIRLEESASSGPVEITMQPQDQVVFLADPLNIYVGVVGAEPYFFQWYRDGTAVPEATNQTYFVNYAYWTNGGDYYVIVSNLFSAATSSVARITITNALVITSHPQSQTILLGQKAVFSVSVTNGIRPVYQWYSNNLPVLYNGTSNSLTISNVSMSAQGAIFQAVIRKGLNSVTSNPAILTIDTTPQVLFIARTNLNPADLAISNLLAAQDFIVIVQDDRSSQLSQTNYKALVVISSSVDPAQVSGKFNLVSTPVMVWESGLYSSMMLTAGSNTNYQGTFSNQLSISIYDPLQPLAAGYSNINQVFTSGDTMNYGVPGGNAYVVATATNNTEFAVIFGYEKGALMANNILPANGRRVGFFLGDNGATNLTAAGSNLFNAAVQWAVDTAPTNLPVGITREPSDTSALEGTTASFSVIVTGTPPYYFQWMKNGTNIAGAAGRTYTTPLLTELDDNATFSVRVTNRIDTTVYSRNALLTVLPPQPVIITCQPQDVVVRSGQNASFTVCATGGLPRIQWYKDGLTITNATNATLTVTNATAAAAGAYYAIATNRLYSATSRAAQFVVLNPPRAILEMTNTCRYNTNGTDQWGFAAPSFDDSSWPAGAGVFCAPPNEPLPSGAVRGTGLPVNLPDNSQCIRTMYFRTHFNFSDNPGGIMLLVSNLIDDGAVFYLNGEEIQRIRMPSGLISYTNLASGSVGDTAWAAFEISPYSLNPGDNLLAVEVHQVATNSADLVFGALVSQIEIAPTLLAITNQPQSLVLSEYQSGMLSLGVAGAAARYQWYKDGWLLPGAVRPYLNISNVTEADTGVYFVTVSNAFSYLLSSNAYVSVFPDTNPPVLLRADGNLSPTNIILSFSEPISIIEATNLANYTVSNVLQGSSLVVRRAILTNGTNVILITQQARSAGNNYIVFVREIRDLARQPNTIQSGNASPVETLQAVVSALSYYDYFNPVPPWDDPNIGDSWREREYLIPESWGNNECCPGAFWLGTNVLPVPLGKELSPSSAVVSYFQAPFSFTGNPFAATLKLRHLVNSGAVFYFDGEEILRVNMPPGPINYASTAMSNIANPSWSPWIDIEAELLGRESHVLAVELHSRLAYQSHLAFAAELQAPILSVPIGPVIITRQPEDQVVIEGQQVRFSFIAAGAKYFQWFMNGAPVPGATSGSFIIPWAMLAWNNSEVFVIASNDTDSVTSQVAKLTVLADTTPPALFSAITLSSNTVRATFSEPISFATATNLLNYALTNEWGQLLTIYSASLTNGTNVILITDPWLGPLTLVVNNLRDLAAAENQIAPNSAATVGAYLQIPIDALWLYNNMGTNLFTEWRELAYDDSTWRASNALFYAGPNNWGGLGRTRLATNNSAGNYIMTFYYRLHLRSAMGASNANCTLRHIIDDGAIFYLNGSAIYNYNMRSNPVYGDTANSTIATAGFSDPINIVITNLLPGDNVLAVEVHQVTPTSSDMAFAAELSIVLPSVTLPVTNFPPAAPTLHAWKTGGGTWLWWTGNRFMLERANFLASPFAATVWTAVDVFNSSTNYYWIPPASSNAFYRLISTP